MALKAILTSARQTVVTGKRVISQPGRFYEVNDYCFSTYFGRQGLIELVWTGGQQEVEKVLQTESERVGVGKDLLNNEGLPALGENVFFFTGLTSNFQHCRGREMRERELLRIY